MVFTRITNNNSLAHKLESRFNQIFPKHPNSIVRVLGENGSGKSSLLRLIAMSSSSRTKHWHNNLSKAIVSDFYIKSSMKVKNSASVFADIYGECNIETLTKDHTKLGLDQFSNTSISNLSTGNLKKLHFCYALNSSNEMVLLDEPFENLDRKSINTLSCIIQRESNQKLIVFSDQRTESPLQTKDHEVI